MTEAQCKAALKSEGMKFDRQLCIVNKAVRKTQDLLGAISFDVKSVEASKNRFFGSGARKKNGPLLTFF